MRIRGFDLVRWVTLALLVALLAACASGGPLVTPGRTTAGGGLIARAICAARNLWRKAA